jgi:hypothetical protein
MLGGGHWNTAMDMSLVTSALAMQASQTRQALGLTMVKQANDMEQAMIAMLTQAVEAGRAALADGVGQSVDITA